MKFLLCLRVRGEEGKKRKGGKKNSEQPCLAYHLWYFIVLLPLFFFSLTFSHPSFLKTWFYFVQTPEGEKRKKKMKKKGSLEPNATLIYLYFFFWGGFFFFQSRRNCCCWVYRWVDFFLPFWATHINTHSHCTEEHVALCDYVVKKKKTKTKKKLQKKKEKKK